jgi:hypothetical protein
MRSSSRAGEAPYGSDLARSFSDASTCSLEGPASDQGVLTLDGYCFGRKAAVSARLSRSMQSRRPTLQWFVIAMREKQQSYPKRLVPSAASLAGRLNASRDDASALWRPS